jgi:hypothetical protein
MIKEDDKFTKSDLVLLMESYNNMMRMHETVLNQQTEIIDMQKKITEKQDATINKQGSTCNKLNIVANRLDDCAIKLKETSVALNNVEDNIVYKVEDTKSIITDYSIKSIEAHSSIKNKIYLGWIGMGTLAIGLVAIITMLLGRPDKIEEIYKVVTSIARYFGLGS